MLELLSKHKAIALTTSRITLSSSSRSMSHQRYVHALPWQHYFQIADDSSGALQLHPYSMDLRDSVPVIIH